MERSRAIEIIHDEGLINYNFFDDRDDRENEVVIVEKTGKWIVYVTDERASEITNSSNEYINESEAIDNFIKRLRTFNKVLRRCKKRTTS